MALQAAVHGQGIALANRILAQQEIENGHLQIVFVLKIVFLMSSWTIPA